MRIRRAWRCPCDGVSHEVACAPMHPAVSATREIIRSVVGTAPTTCPFQAFSDPLVREVLTLDRELADGGAALVSPRDVPATVRAGRLAFQTALTRARNEIQQREIDEIRSRTPDRGGEP